MLFLPFSNSLLIINGVNQRPVSKSMFANLTTVLVFYLLSLPMCCTPNSDIDSSRSHPITNGIGQKRVRSFNDLVLLVFKGLFVTGGPCTWSFRSRPSLTYKFLQALFLPSATSELFGYNRSCDVRLLLFIGSFGFNW